MPAISTRLAVLCLVIIGSLRWTRKRAPGPQAGYTSSGPSASGKLEYSGEDKGATIRQGKRDGIGVLLGGGGLLAIGVSLLTLVVEQRQTSDELRATLAGQLNARYEHAIQLLGSDELPVRLTGIHELARVAEDAGEADQRLVEQVLVDYVREYTRVPVWRTPVPVVAGRITEIQAILRVIGQRPKASERDGMDLSQTNLSGFNLQQAHLEHADFSHATLANTSLTGTHFSNATLAYSDLRGADLANADLSGTDLTCADLRGVDLSRAVGLSQVQLDEAYVDEKTVAPSDLNLPPPRGEYNRTRSYTCELDRI